MYGGVQFSPDVDQCLCDRCILECFHANNYRGLEADITTSFSLVYQSNKSASASQAIECAFDGHFTVTLLVFLNSG